jgi:LEA14-like dessication related protein
MVTFARNGVTLRWLGFCVGLLLLSACAGLRPEIDPPQISVDSIESLAGAEGMPKFLIKLRVANPNKQALDIAGISYSISILDKELISGVSNKVPLIEPYSEGVVELEASLKLFQIIRLITGLAQNQHLETLEYSFAAKIDFNGWIPTQRVKETGEINLSQAVSPAVTGQK